MRSIGCNHNWSDNYHNKNNINDNNDISILVIAKTWGERRKKRKRLILKIYTYYAYTLY